jgi:hypothetical protein
MAMFDYGMVLASVIIGLGVTHLLIGVADTLAKGIGHFLTLGPLYVIGQVVMISLFITALRTRNERFHAFFAIYAIAWLLIYPSTNFDTIQQTAIGVVHQ